MVTEHLVLTVQYLSDYSACVHTVMLDEVLINTVHREFEEVFRKTFEMYSILLLTLSIIKHY